MLSDFFMWVTIGAIIGFMFAIAYRIGRLVEREAYIKELEALGRFLDFIAKENKRLDVKRR